LAEFCRQSKPNPADAVLLGETYRDVLRARFRDYVGHPPDARRLRGEEPATFCTAFTGDAFVYYRVETVSIGIFAKKTIVTLLRL